MEKLPPIEKIYEAYSALADNRIHMEETSAKVVSSDGAKSYKVILPQTTLPTGRATRATLSSAF